MLEMPAAHLLKSITFHLVICYPITEKFPMSTRPFIFADHQLEAVRDVKLQQYVIANLNLKGLSSFYTRFK